MVERSICFWLNTCSLTNQKLHIDGAYSNDMIVLQSMRCQACLSHFLCTLRHVILSIGRRIIDFGGVWWNAHHRLVLSQFTYKTINCKDALPRSWFIYDQVWPPLKVMGLKLNKPISGSARSTRKKHGLQRRMHRRNRWDSCETQGMGIPIIDLRRSSDRFRFIYMGDSYSWRTASFYE